MLEKNRKFFTRDPKQLSQEIDLSIELKDIKRSQDLHQQLRMSWFERGIFVLIFIAMVAFLSTLIVMQRTESESIPDMLYYILYASLGFLMFSLVMVLEMIWSKLAVIRRLYLILENNITKLEKELKNIESKKE